jgi:hypothetical protein
MQQNLIDIAQVVSDLIKTHRQIHLDTENDLARLSMIIVYGLTFRLMCTNKHNSQLIAAFGQYNNAVQSDNSDNSDSEKIQIDNSIKIDSLFFNICTCFDELQIQTKSLISEVEAAVALIRPLVTTQSEKNKSLKETKDNLFIDLEELTVNDFFSNLKLSIQKFIPSISFDLYVEADQFPEKEITQSFPGLITLIFPSIILFLAKNSVSIKVNVSFAADKSIELNKQKETIVVGSIVINIQCSLFSKTSYSDNIEESANISTVNSLLQSIRGSYIVPSNFDSSSQMQVRQLSLPCISSGN